MVSRPLVTPSSALSRSILLPASFAGCAMMLAMLLVTLVGCADLLGLDEVTYNKVTPNNHNAILCACECEGAVETPVPTANTIRAGADDVAQSSQQTTVSPTGQALTLGNGGNVGLRFLKLGVPPKADITSASIQFTAAQADDSMADFDIFAVDSASALPFDTNTDLRVAALISAPVQWAPPAWLSNERGDSQKTPDLKALVKAIVDHADYTPDSAIAFVIRGSGKRSARAFEGTASGRPASLTVAYTPRKITQEFLACGNVDDKDNVCQNLVQSNVSSLAQQCKLANACTCKVKTGPNIDTTSFSVACNNPCPKIVAPADCDPLFVGGATAATNGHTPVCVASSPLGSAVFGQLSACDLDESRSAVSVRVFDEDDTITETARARGRIEFEGPPCPGDSCLVDVRYRTRIGDLTFKGGLFAKDHVLNQLSAVGADDMVLGNGAGVALPSSSLRGNEVGGDTVAVSTTAPRFVDVSLADWQPGGLCTVHGFLLQGRHIEVFADLKGTLVNQPPTVDVGSNLRTVECNATGRGLFTLEASAQDLDNNIASFGWFRGGWTGALVGTLPTVELDQSVKTTALYVFKAIDVFGSYGDDTVHVNVVDTTSPTVTAPPAVTAECTGPAGTAVAIGTASATDVCDDSPDLTNDAPQLYKLGPTTVTWTATDDSLNKATATQTVTIVDTTPPELTVQLSRAGLWQPNHKLVQITATITVRDKCDPNPTVKLVSIISNELDNGRGDGDKPEDIQEAKFGTDDREFLLRAERSGLGTGRVYTVTYQASDASGNTTTKKATVTVPKSQ